MLLSSKNGLDSLFKEVRVFKGYPENQEKLVFGYPVLRSKPQCWIPELRFGYPPLRKFSTALFWEELGSLLKSLGGSQRQLCIRTRPLSTEFPLKML